MCPHFLDYKLSNTTAPYVSIPWQLMPTQQLSSAESALQMSNPLLKPSNLWDLIKHYSFGDQILWFSNVLCGEAVSFVSPEPSNIQLHRMTLSTCITEEGEKVYPPTFSAPYIIISISIKSSLVCLFSKLESHKCYNLSAQKSHFPPMNILVAIF